MNSSSKLPVYDSVEARDCTPSQQNSGFTEIKQDSTSLRIIQSDVELINWLFSQLLQAQPRVQVCSKLVDHARLIIEDCTVVGQYPKCINVETIKQSFELLMNAMVPQKMEETSEALLSFIGSVYATFAVGGLDIEMDKSEVIFLLTAVMRYERRYLRKRKLSIYSTPRCVQELGIIVDVHVKKSRNDPAFGNHPLSSSEC